MKRLFVFLSVLTAATAARADDFGALDALCEPPPDLAVRVVKNEIEGRLIVRRSRWQQTCGQPASLDFSDGYGNHETVTPGELAIGKTPCRAVEAGLSCGGATYIYASQEAVSVILQKIDEKDAAVEEAALLERGWTREFVGKALSLDLPGRFFNSPAEVYLPIYQRMKKAAARFNTLYASATPPQDLVTMMQGLVVDEQKVRQGILDAEKNRREETPGVDLNDLNRENRIGALQVQTELSIAESSLDDVSPKR